MVSFGSGNGNVSEREGVVTINDEPCIEIGILTKGKPTLSMVLTSLLLQDTANLRIHIVDTSESPVINRDDVAFALRLAFDRGISCEYEVSKAKGRAFSVGRLKLLEALKGHHTCFVDDDVVLPSSALKLMKSVIRENSIYGYITPFCKNAGVVSQQMVGVNHYSPGGIFYQDQLVRDVLMEYYSTTVDVLDQQKASEKVWEIAFLSHLFSLLGRQCIVQENNIVYHLDYREKPNWALLEPRLVSASARKARELLNKNAVTPSKVSL